MSPAWVAENGYRWYGEDELVRLQQILLLRELDVGLEAIAAVLDDGKDPADVLRTHRDALRRERHRLDRLVRTVSATITELEGGTPVSADNMFDGFDKVRMERDRADLRNHLVAKYGEDALVDEKFAASAKATEGWTQDDYRRSFAEGAALNQRLLAVLRSGAAVDSAETFAVLDDHYASVSRFWTPDRGSYTGLGELYVEHEKFREMYSALDPALPEYPRDAMAAYARVRLS